MAEEPTTTSVTPAKPGRLRPILTIGAVVAIGVLSVLYAREARLRREAAGGGPDALRDQSVSLLEGLGAAAARLPVDDEERIALLRANEIDALVEAAWDDPDLLVRLGTHQLHVAPALTASSDATNDDVEHAVGWLRQAVDLFTRAQTIDADRYDVVLGRHRAMEAIGDYSIELGDEDEARRAFRASLEDAERAAVLRPEDATARLGSFVALARLATLASDGESSDIDDLAGRAREVAQSITITDGTTGLRIADAYAALGQALDAKGRPEDALATWREAIGVIDGVDTQQANAELQVVRQECATMIANAALRDGDLTRARSAGRELLSAASRAIAASPDHPELRRQLGESHAKIGEYRLLLAGTHDTGTVQRLRHVRGAVGSFRRARDIFLELRANEVLGETGLARLQTIESGIALLEEELQRAAAEAAAAAAAEESAAAAAEPAPSSAPINERRSPESDTEPGANPG